MKNYLSIIRKELKKAKSIAIFIHESPDGDAIGSSSALFYYLKDKGFDVDLYSKDNAPKKLNWVECINQYKKEVDKEKIYDIGFILDCSNRFRTGMEEDCFANVKKFIRIDHHLDGEKCSKSDIVSTISSSTCELMYDILSFDKKSVNEKIANSLLFGLLTDSCSFQNSNTTKHTLENASKLMECGANLCKMEEYAFSTNSLEEMEITKVFYSKAKIDLKNKIAYSYVDYKSIAKIGANKEDLQGHANILRNIDGINLAFVLYEIEPSVVTGSIRSCGNISTKNIADKLLGGGHLNASGFKMENVKMEDVIKLVLKYCIEEIKRCQKME